MSETWTLGKEPHLFDHAADLSGVSSHVCDVLADALSRKGLDPDPQAIPGGFLWCTSLADLTSIHAGWRESVEQADPHGCLDVTIRVDLDLRVVALELDGKSVVSEDVAADSLESALCIGSQSLEKILSDDPAAFWA